jgi:hypothetical protein
MADLIDAFSGGVKRTKEEKPGFRWKHFIMKYIRSLLALSALLRGKPSLSGVGSWQDWRTLCIVE